ncbi:MAG: hypothetical protein GY822_28300 [Deltaproteobacteria bacterium]|nr:hypothetical protein [Deltaproteobacteria bacterium]
MKNLQLLNQQSPMSLSTKLSKRPPGFLSMPSKTCTTLPVKYATLSLAVFAFLVAGAAFAASSLPSIEDAVATGQVESATLKATGATLNMSSLRGLQPEQYLSRRRPEANVSFEAAHKEWPAALVFTTLQELVGRPLGDGGKVHSFTKPDEVDARFPLNAKEKAALAGKEHLALVEGLLLALGESKHELAPLWLRSIQTKNISSWEATRWIAYGVSLRSHAARDELLAPIESIVVDEKKSTLVREAAFSAFGSVPSEKALDDVSRLLQEKEVQRARLEKVGIVALGRMGDARLSRRRGRPAFAARVFQKLQFLATAGDSEANVSAYTTALVGSASELSQLERAAIELRQAGKTTLATKLEEHLRVRARRHQR